MRSNDLGLGSFPLGRIPGDQLIEVVTIGTDGAKGLFIEQALNAATQTYLIGVLVGSDRPAHLAMPATPEKDHPSPRQPSGNP